MADMTDLTEVLELLLFAAVALGASIATIVRSVRRRRVTPQDPSHVLRWVIYPAVALLASVGFLWTTNTARLDLNWQASPDRAAPGDEISITHNRSCNPNLVLTYRSQLLGRWQRTHTGDQPDLRRWWDLSTDSFAEIMLCAGKPNGTFTYRLPTTVTAGRIAICDTSNNCAQVTIDPDA